MTHARLLIAALAASLVSGCATARRAPEAPLVDELVLRGNASLEGSEIEARILTAGTSWVPFTERHYLDEAVLETDLKRIVRFYQARGFYKARIAGLKVEPAGERKVAVTIQVEEGPPTLVGELELAGLDELEAPLREQVTRGLPLAVGARFGEEELDGAKAMLLDRLLEAGFAEAEVQGRARVSLPDDRAQVTLVADAGPRYRFATLFVAGANRVPRQRIVDEARKEIVEGQLFKASALSKAEGRIFDMGVFAAVKVTRGAPNRRAGTVPVVVSVREAPFRTIRVGGGLGIDNERFELPRLLGEWSNRNFFGGLRRLTVGGGLALVFTGGPEELLGFRERPRVAGNARLEFEQPRLFGADLSLVSSLTYERGVQNDFTFHSLGASVGLPWKIGPRFTFVPSYNFQLFQLSTDVVLRAGAVGQDAALDPCATRKVGDEDPLCRLGYLEQRFSYDGRDNPIEPTRGYLLNLSLQEGSSRLGGNFDYLRLLPEVRAYVPAGKHVVAARVMGGLLMPSDDQASSVLTRFHLGGSSSHRGFGNGGLSPRLDDDPLDETNELLELGGDGMMVANLEARFRMTNDLGLVVFADAGQVQPSIADMSLGGMHVALGLGLRYRTMFGPVRADIGYRINDPGIARVGRDGAELEPVRTPHGWGRVGLHLSIGEAF